MSRQKSVSLMWSLILVFSLAFPVKPAAAQTPDPVGTELDDDDDGFDDWGLLGLLGLLGLMGRRRDTRDTVDTRRV